VRRGLCAILETHAGWEVCGEASDGREAVEKTKQLRPDIVILDLGMPSLNGLDATRQILHYNPQQRILILTVTDAEQVIEEVLKAGARGFVLKTDAAQDLATAVEALEQGRTFFNSRVGELVLNGFSRGNGRTSTKEVGLPRLTAREREVVQLLAEGKSNVGPQRKDGGDTPQQHHAQTGCPLFERVGAVRGSQPHSPGRGARPGRPCRGPIGHLPNIGTDVTPAA
jgi:DNA-binding NarL/FixJ family response regulator